MAGAYDGEVASVDGRNLVDKQSFCRGHNGCVHRTQRQISITCDKFGDSEPVRGSHRFDAECAVSEIAQESDLSVRAEASTQQVDHLGDDKRRDDQRAGMRLQQPERRSMMGIIGVDIRIQRAGIDDNRGYCPTSAARISSMRCEMSEWPLRPALAA